MHREYATRCGESRVPESVPIFFEQKRLLEKKPKSAARLSNEAMLAANKEKMMALWGGNTELAAKYATEGFALRHDDGKRIVFGR